MLLQREQVSQDYYLVVRVYFVSPAWKLESFVLALRHFNPSHQLRSTHRLSNLQGLWAKMVFQQYGFNISDLYGSTSDAGSDIKRLTQTVLKTQWNWCPPHMITAAVKEAFGMNADSMEESNNPEARALISRIVRTMTIIQTSTTAGSLWDDLRSAYGDRTNIKSYQVCNAADKVEVRCLHY